jgi:hypothetical protein
LLAKGRALVLRVTAKLTQIVLKLAPRTLGLGLGLGLGLD